MTIFLTFIFTAILLFTTSEWITSLLTSNSLAEIGVVILGIVALSASVQIRILFKKAQDILRLYAKYTNPKSEEGRKLSPQEKDLSIITNYYCLNYRRKSFPICKETYYEIPSLWEASYHN